MCRVSLLPRSAAWKSAVVALLCRRSPKKGFVECGGKRSATPLFFGEQSPLGIYDATVQPITSILFAFVFLRGDDAIFDGVGVHGNADPIEDGEPEPESSACDRGKTGKSEHNQRTDGKKKSDAAITFINMAESGDDAEQRGHSVARCALRRLGGTFPFPIATITGLCVFRQTLPAIRTKHRIRGLSGRSVRVFHQIK